MSPNITTSLCDMRRTSDVRRIKRNLFGPIDQEKSKLWVESQLENLLANACEKWDFDFRNEKPLNSENSQYVWERIESNSSMEPPSPKSVAMRGLRYPMDLVQDEQNNNIENSVQYVVKTGDILSFKQRQTKMTDYLNKRKRPMSLSTPSMKRLKDSLPTSAGSSSSTSASSQELSHTTSSAVARLLF